MTEYINKEKLIKAIEDKRPLNWNDTEVELAEQRAFDYIMELIKGFCDDETDRLKELAKADKEGRCLVLPCKVGDTVYYIYKDCPKDYKPQYCTDHLGSCENCTHRVAAVLKTTFTLPMIDNVKNIYLTKQEAEKALEGLK